MNCRKLKIMESIYVRVVSINSVKLTELKEEVERLRLKVCANERKSKEGFFGSSTPSSQVPVKKNSLAENQAKKGGAKVGHKGFGRQVFTQEETDEVLVAGQIS